MVVPTSTRNHHGIISSMLSIFRCCSTKSQHFHANRVEDSFHVMIKHDINVAKKKGKIVPGGYGYRPRNPLPDSLVRRSVSPIVIQATEDETNTDKQLLAALRE